MFGISGVYICVTRVRGNILWLGNGAPASAVGLSCLRHLAAIVVARGSSGGSSVKDYLVSFCMYVICGFRPTLGGAILPVPVVSSSSMGEVFRGVLLARCRLVCVLCALCVVIGLYVLVFSSRVLHLCILVLVLFGGMVAM